jgi:hypothetical protein
MVKLVSKQLAKSFVIFKPLILVILLAITSLASYGATAKYFNLTQHLSHLASIADPIQPNVLRLALTAYNCALKKGLEVKPYLTIVDFTRPSDQKRLWVLDMLKDRVLFHTLVAQGKNSGDLYASHFSNQDGSLASSIGLYQTGQTYSGHHGYSLKLKGLEKGFNDHAQQRHIVIHGAWYVSENFIKKHTRLGRSWGCFALNEQVVRPVVEQIKNGSLIFAYYPDQAWLSHSRYLHCH